MTYAGMMLQCTRIGSQWQKKRWLCRDEPGAEAHATAESQ